MITDDSGSAQSGYFKHVYVDGTIQGSNLKILGDFVTLDTITSNTEQMVITNAGTGPALKVTQTGANSIAEFYDDGNVLALKIADGGNVGIGTGIPLAHLHVNGTGAMIIPSGTTDQLPLIPTIGMIRFNTTSSRLQYYTQIGWASVGGITATGGVINDIGSYRIHTFTSSGTLTMVTGGQIDYLVCGGGGGGGCDRAGGGGAGGILVGQTNIISGTYIVTVGDGGNGATTDSVKGGNGTNSSLGNLFIAIGGGGGGSENTKQGNNGGSGGGNSYGLATLSSGTAGQGNAGGGNGDDAPNRKPAGGGGAGAAGGVPHGGLGVLSSISGTSLSYAGGGGGGTGGSGGSSTYGIGGSGVGGNGGRFENTALTYGQPGMENRGGGGGGGAGNDTGGIYYYDSARGGNGGSGIVIVRYLL